MSTVTWSAEEQDTIDRKKGAREKNRERNRLLHNRRQRVMATTSSSAGPPGKMRCVNCGGEAEWWRVLQWPRTRCKALKERPEEEKTKANK